MELSNLNATNTQIKMHVVSLCLLLELYTVLAFNVSTLRLLVFSFGFRELSLSIVERQLVWVQTLHSPVQPLFPKMLLMLSQAP